jgi:hypothetical protein
LLFAVPLKTLISSANCNNTIAAKSCEENTKLFLPYSCREEIIRVNINLDTLVWIYDL